MNRFHSTTTIITVGRTPLVFYALLALLAMARCPLGAAMHTAYANASTLLPYRHHVTIFEDAHRGGPPAPARRQTTDYYCGTLTGEYSGTTWYCTTDDYCCGTPSSPFDDYGNCCASSGCCGGTICCAELGGTCQDGACCSAGGTWCGTTCCASGEVCCTGGDSCCSPPSPSPTAAMTPSRTPSPSLSPSPSVTPSPLACPSPTPSQSPSPSTSQTPPPVTALFQPVRFFASPFAHATVGSFSCSFASWIGAGPRAVRLRDALRTVETIRGEGLHEETSLAQLIIVVVFSTTRHIKDDGSLSSIVATQARTHPKNPY